MLLLHHMFSSIICTIAQFRVFRLLIEGAILFLKKYKYDEDIFLSSHRYHVIYFLFLPSHYFFPVNFAKLSLAIRAKA